MGVRMVLGVICMVGAALAMADSGSVRLVMPTALYATPGVEANLYLESVILALNPANYTFDVNCEKGYQQAERWTFTPTAEDVGRFPLTLRVLDQDNTVVAEGSSTVVVTDAAVVKERLVTAMIVGDSLTNASIYTRTLLEHCAGPNTPSLTLVGTHGPTDEPANRHEGYGGWTAARFATHFTDARRDAPYNERPSPFVYKNEVGEIGLDFPRYCAENNGGMGPDVVTLFLGCNDTFSATDENIDAVIDAMLGHMNSLIGMIHGVNSETVIGLIAPVPPTVSQDAFGANYNNGQTRWQYRRNQHRVVERMAEAYGNREGEHIHLIPAYVNLDAHRNYPTSTAPANARTTVEVERQNNSVHPNAAGYQQIGDSVYGWLLANVE